MCTACDEHSKYSDRRLRELCALGEQEKDGVCTRLHASGREIRATARIEAKGEHDMRKRSRSAPSRPLQLDPVTSSPKRAPTGKRRKKGRKTMDSEGFKNTVANFISGKELKDKSAVEKGIIEALVRDKQITVNPTGRSKSTVSKMNATAAKVLNGAASLLGSAGNTTSDEYRHLMVEQAYKKEPELSPNNHSDAVTASEQDARARAEVNQNKQRCEMIGTILKDYAHIVKEMNTPAERRPYIALLANSEGMTRPMAEKEIGISINKTEWTKARVHARWPGALKPAQKVKIFRQRVSTQLLQSFLVFLENPGNLQRYAYGTKLLNLAEGSSGSRTVEIDKVDRLKKIEDLTVEYILALDADLNGAGDCDDEEMGDQRCACREKVSLRRCRLKEGHEKKHRYTAKGSLSVSTVRNLVKTMTGEDIKRLSGLDDTKVLKGRDNFKRMRRLVDELCVDIDKRNELTKAIDDSEVFYLTDFQNHLQREGTQACQCLTCGYCEEADTDGITCNNMNQHENSCENCSKSYGVIDELRELAVIKRRQLADRGCSMKEQDQGEDTEIEIETCLSDLDEYRGHLARHKSEADFDADELDSLADDTAVVISDFKMKILSCFFRENQLKFFGKRGTSCLGFMVITNSEDAEVRANGIKEVKFIMMFSDDAKQDELSIASAKYEVYTKHLPPEVSKVRFHSDGAGAFQSAYHKAVQPMWLFWTGGIEEEVNRVTPAGGGKSALDGMFGRLTSVLHSSVDSGNSYHDAKTTCEAMEASGGLAATTVIRYQPHRTSRLYVSFAKAKLNSVLRSKINSDRSITVSKHSGYGVGRKVFMSDVAYSLVCKPTTPMINQDRDLLYRRKNFRPPELLTKYLLSFLERNDRPGKASVSAIESFFEYKHFKNVIMHQLLGHHPYCDFVQEYDNRKKDVRSVKSKAGEGENHPNRRQESREKRGNARARKDQMSIEEIRKEKEAAGIFLCHARCPETLHFCRCEYLREENLIAHLETEPISHRFPLGISSNDKALSLASQPGGLVAVGNRSNRKDSFFKSFPSAVDGTKGARAAVCFQKFNRIDDREQIRKTKLHISTLNEIFHGHEPKLNGAQARELMKRMIDPKDGGLLFCWRKKGIFMPQTGVHKAAYEAWEGCPECNQKPCECNGQLLPENIIHQYFSKLFAQQKKRGNLTEKQAQQEATHDALVADLEAT